MDILQHASSLTLQIKEQKEDATAIGDLGKGSPAKWQWLERREVRRWRPGLQTTLSSSFAVKGREDLGGSWRGYEVQGRMGDTEACFHVSGNIQVERGRGVAQGERGEPREPKWWGPSINGGVGLRQQTHFIHGGTKAGTDAYSLADLGGGVGTRLFRSMASLLSTM